MNRRELCAGAAAAAGVLVTGGLSGCGGKKKDGAPAVSIRGMQVGLVLTDADDRYNRAMEDAVKDLADENSMNLSREDGKGRAGEQARAIEQLLQKNVNILLIQPVDPEKLKGALEAAAKNRTVVVAMERAIPSPNVTALVEVDQERSGQLTADFLRTKLKSGDTVGLLTGPERSDQTERVQAFKAYLKEKVPGVTVAAEESAPNTEDARGAIDRLLKGHAELDAIYALTDALAVELAKTLREKGARKPLVVTYGGTPDSIKEIQREDSPLAMVVTVQPQKIARAALRLALRAATNKKTTKHRRMAPFPITKENYGSWPDYYGDLPRDAPLAWESEIPLEARNEEP